MPTSLILQFIYWLGIPSVYFSIVAITFIIVWIGHIYDYRNLNNIDRREFKDEIFGIFFASAAASLIWAGPLFYYVVLGVKNGLFYILDSNFSLVTVKNTLVLKFNNLKQWCQSRRSKKVMNHALTTEKAVVITKAFETDRTMDLK